jgi:hypothetical protein
MVLTLRFWLKGPASFNQNLTLKIVNFLSAVVILTFDISSFLVVSLLVAKSL